MYYLMKMNKSTKKLKILKTANMKQYMRDYRSSDQGARNQRKAFWTHIGMIFEDQFDIVYNDYLAQTNCECCGVEFDGQNKNLDHDHNNKTSYNIRGIICTQCNHRRKDKLWSNSTGERHIFWNESVKRYDLRIRLGNEFLIQCYHKNLQEAVKIRDKFIDENPWIYT